MFRSRATKTRQLKKGIDGDDARRKRGEVTTELRKKGRDEQLLKRRTRPDAQSEPTTPGGTKMPSEMNLQAFLEDCASADPMRQETGSRGFRKLLSIQENPPIEAVIRTGVVRRLVEFLKATHQPILQFEAAWALTNIASGTREQTKCVIDSGAIPMFTQLLMSPVKDVREQAVWAIGNIAGDCAAFRDLVLQAGALRPLTNCCAPPKSGEAQLSLVRNATWAISNCCRGKPEPPFQAIRHVIPVLAWLISNVHDEEVLTDAAWAISYVTDDNTKDNSKIQAVLETNIAPRLIRLLGNSSSKVLTPCLRACGNIVTGNDKQTQAMLDQGLLQALLPALSSPKRSLRKEACWTVSNVTAGTPSQIEAVINANVIPTVLQILRKDEFVVQREATWAISNITTNGKARHTQYLVEQGAIPPLCDILGGSEPRLMAVALEGIDNILKVGQADGKSGENKYANIVEECGGLDKIEALQRHENEEIYEKSVAIIQKYFSSEEDEDAALVPETTGSQFTFGGFDKAGGFTFGGAQRMPELSF